MAQIPKGRLVKGPYKPICRDCAIYFIHPNTYAVWNLFNIWMHIICIFNEHASITCSIWLCLKIRDPWKKGGVELLKLETSHNLFMINLFYSFYGCFPDFFSWSMCYHAIFESDFKLSFDMDIVFLFATPPFFQGSLILRHSHIEQVILVCSLNIHIICIHILNRFQTA